MHYRWVGDNRVTPVYDTEQDLTSVSFLREDGITYIEFTRKLNTGNAQDIALDTDTPVYFIWAFGGTVTSYVSPATFTGRHTNQGPFGGVDDTFTFTECALAAGTGTIASIILLLNVCPF